MSEGWICPRCGKGLAPWMSECNCYLTRTAESSTFSFTTNPCVVANKICSMCDNTDGTLYTSNPPKVKCGVTGRYHFLTDICDCDGGE